MSTKRWLLFVITLWLSSTLLAQNTRLEVKDAKTNEAIAFAHLIVKSLSDQSEVIAITNDQGIAEFDLTGQALLQITFVGYRLLEDTITGGNTIPIQLYPSNFNIHEVVVTGQLEPQRVDQSIYKVKVINAKEIEEKAASTVHDLVGSELKFRSFNDGVLGSSISIQGLSGNNVKILIDGVPVLGREGGNVDLSQLNLYNVDHIEIVEGPLSVIYGSNSLAGAINIITKENKYYRLKTNVNTYYESTGKYNTDVALAFRKDNSSWSFSGGRNFSQESDLDPDERNTLWKPKEQYLADAYYVFDDEKNKIKLKSSFLKELLIDKGTPRAPYGEEVRDVYLRTFRGTYSATYDRKISKDKALTFLASYSRYSRVNEDFLKDLTTLDMTSVELDTTISRNTILRGEWKNFSENRKYNYQFGYDFNHESGSGAKIVGNEKSIGDLAIYWSAQYRHLKLFQIQPGLRYSYNTRFSSPLVPSLNVKVSPGEYFDFRASYVRGFRSPGIKELFMDFHDTNHNLEGNPDLESELGHNVNFSVNVNTDKLHKLHYSNLKLDFFYNYMENKIDLAVIDADELYYRYINVARYGTVGGFAQFEYRFHPYLKLSLGYGRTGYINSEDGENLDYEEIVYNQDYTTSMTYSIIPIDLDISLFYKYNGKLPRYSINEENILEYSYLNPYHTMDISFNTNFFNQKLKVSAGIKNLFDNYVVEQSGAGGAAHSGGSAMPVSMGRSFFIKLGYQFNRV